MSLVGGILPRSDLRMPHLGTGWVVRARVPLRDQPPADRFGDRLRAVDHSEFHADRPHVLIGAVLGDTHDLADFPIVFPFGRPLQSLALARRETHELARRRFLLERDRARYRIARDECQHCACVRLNTLDFIRDLDRARNPEDVSAQVLRHVAPFGAEA